MHAHRKHIHTHLCKRMHSFRPGLREVSRISLHHHLLLPLLQALSLHHCSLILMRPAPFLSSCVWMVLSRFAALACLWPSGPPFTPSSCSCFSFHAYDDPKNYRRSCIPLTLQTYTNQPAKSVRQSVPPLPAARRVHRAVNVDIKSHIKNSECICGPSQGNSKNTSEISSLQRVILLWRYT